MFVRYSSMNCQFLLQSLDIELAQAEEKPAPISPARHALYQSYSEEEKKVFVPGYDPERMAQLEKEDNPQVNISL